TAEDLSQADSGYIRFALDPSGGSILSLLVQAPGFIERIHQGGLVGYIIIAIGVIALFIALLRWMALGSVSRKVNAQISSKAISEDNPLGRVLKVYDKNESINTESL